MAEFYTNLPKTIQDRLDKSADKLKTDRYEEEFQFNASEYDSAIAFFVKRGFGRDAAEATAYVILSQAKIDNMSPQEIIDQLTYASEAQLSELITIILNANRFKSSKLGVRQNRSTKETVSRNILD